MLQLLEVTLCLRHLAFLRVIRFNAFVWAAGLAVREVQLLPDLQGALAINHLLGLMLLLLEHLQLQLGVMAAELAALMEERVQQPVVEAVLVAIFQEWLCLEETEKIEFLLLKELLPAHLDEIPLLDLLVVLVRLQHTTV